MMSLGKLIQSCNQPPEEEIKQGQHPEIFSMLPTRASNRIDWDEDVQGANTRVSTLEHETNSNNRVIKIINLLKFISYTKKIKF